MIRDQHKILLNSHKQPLKTKDSKTINELDGTMNRE